LFLGVINIIIRIIWRLPGHGESLEPGVKKLKVNVDKQEENDGVQQKKEEE
jgi:hypothetical protein